MFAHVLGETTLGIDGVSIAVEVDVANGLPGFDIVGLPNAAVKESKERVKAAFRNTGLPFPLTHITVNLAPADLKKEGSGLDLAIAVGILASSHYLRQKEVSGKVFIGELSLDGKLREVSGVLSMILEARRAGYQEVYIPSGNEAEGKLVQGLRVYGVPDLASLIAHLKGEQLLPALPKEDLLLSGPRSYAYDFSEVRGQLVARRALEIAAAGGHSILMVGSPGCGKTMLARRLVTIMPPMTEAEALEVTKIYSIVGMLPKGGSIMLERPFRSPHHSVSANALLGGGSVPRPGEVTLSHNGVLFLDELPEFERNTLEMLRQPLEDGAVNISRVRAALSFPSRFLLIGAMNPCPCGYYGDPVHPCTCKPKQIDDYRRRISGPLLDRIDMQINLVRVEFGQLKHREAGEASPAIRQRVVAARQRQLQRFQDGDIYCNAQMGRSQVEQFCSLDGAAQQLLEKYFNALNLSARSHDRILKVARTIADLGGQEEISGRHIAEAISLRTSMQN